MVLIQGVGTEMNQFISLMVAVAVVLPTSTCDARNRHYQACPVNGIYDKLLPLQTSTVRSSLECANTCLMRHDCLSFFMTLDLSQENNNLPICQLSSKVYLCSELETSKIHTYYFASDYEQPEIINPTEESCTGNCGDGIATTDSSMNPASSELVEEEDQLMAWSMVLSADSSGQAITGTVKDVREKVLEGKNVRVSIDKKEKTQLIHLDAVYVSGDGSLVTGTAYMYDSSAIGYSTFVKIEVNTNGQVFEATTIGGVMSQSTIYNSMTWFVSNERSDCQPLTPPPNKTPSRVVSFDDDGFTAYTASSVFDAGLGPFGLGLFVSSGLNNPGMTLSLKRVDLTSDTERETKIDLLTGGGGTFEKSVTWRNSTIFTDTCFDLIVDTTAPFYIEPFLAALQRGYKLVVSYICSDDDALNSESSHVMEVERALITNPSSQFPSVIAYLKNVASYTSGKLSWSGVEVDVVGFLHDDTGRSCSDVRFYAELSREMINVTVTKTEGLSYEDEITLYFYLNLGHLPRLKLERTAGDLEVFTIENADYAVGQSLVLRSYRYVSSLTPAGFHVFTFDVKLCQFSYEVNNMQETLDHPEPIGTQAQSMTLIFEKTDFK